jgi:hypothetical protein
MAVGVGIFLAAAGAILRYAVADNVNNVDLRMVGLILMVVGIIGAIIGLIQSMTARHHVVTEYRDVPPGPRY